MRALRDRGCECRFSGSGVKLKGGTGNLDEIKVKKVGRSESGISGPERDGKRGTKTCHWGIHLALYVA